MQADFRAPRRRCRVGEEYEAPLPVGSRPEERSGFQAELSHQHVLVCQPAHSSALYSKGYFGKGILSRARPDYSISNQWEEHAGLLLPVISQSRYEELLCLARGALSAQGIDEEAVSQALLKLSQPVQVEELRSEVGGEENGDQEKKEEPGPKEEVSPHKKRVWTGLEVEPEAKRSCRVGSEAQLNSEDQNPDPSPQEDHLHSDSYTDVDPGPVSDHSDSGPHPLVPGPAFVLVVSEDEGDGSSREVRRTPFTLTEYLQLSLEEAFFLVYGLGCLSVCQNQEPLSIIQLWRKFRSMRPDFVSLYAAYHYYRSKGWVPKGGGGAKYGVDMMLYRKGPPFYHASYSVVVEKVDETFRGSTLRPFTWRSLATLSRITANVSKELLLCYVLHPADLSEAELDSPLCLHRLTVQEVIVSRWVSSKERAEQDDI